MEKFVVGGDRVDSVFVGGPKPVIIAGPCAIESRDHTLFMAEKIKVACEKSDLGLIFKSCYDKDCRSSIDSFHGVGLEEGLSILSDVRQEIGLPVVSDFSEVSDAPAVGEVCDLVQIPAYLCRQTSILRAAAMTEKPLHLKKGQFMSPWNMRNSLDKLKAFNKDVQCILTDRGTFFGYGQLVNDFTCLDVMRELGVPVGYDATHSIQMPTSMGSISGGQRKFIPSLVRAAVAIGVDVIFMEVHDNPSRALSDPNTQLPLEHLESILSQVDFITKALKDVKAEWAELQVS